jgi:hypothetical protein
MEYLRSQYDLTIQERERLHNQQTAKISIVVILVFLSILAAMMIHDCRKFGDNGEFNLPVQAPE